MDLQTRPCPECGQTAVFRVSLEALRNYQQGMFVQEAFPELSQADRERLISGVCGPCWTELFSEEGEQDED
jgi:hypothetical protein